MWKLSSPPSWCLQKHLQILLILFRLPQFWGLHCIIAAHISWMHSLHRFSLHLIYQIPVQWLFRKAPCKALESVRREGAESVNNSEMKVRWGIGVELAMLSITCSRWHSITKHLNASLSLEIGTCLWTCWYQAYERSSVCWSHRSSNCAQFMFKWFLITLYHLGSKHLLSTQ